MMLRFLYNLAWLQCSMRCWCFFHMNSYFVSLFLQKSFYLELNSIKSFSFCWVYYYFDFLFEILKIYIYILKGSLLELMHGNLMKYYMTDRLVCRLNDFIHLFPFLSLWAFWFFRVIQVWPILESHFFSSCWANENVKLGHWKLLNLSC